MPIVNSLEEVLIKKNNVIYLEEDITFYVRSNGLDTNSGKNIRKAWKTLKHAYQYIKEHVVSNGYKVKLDIENGEYDINDVCTDLFILSPASLSEDKVLIDKEEYKDIKQLEKEINSLESKNKLLENKIDKLANKLDEFKVELAKQPNPDKIKKLNEKLENKVNSGLKSAIKDNKNTNKFVDQLEDTVLDLESKVKYTDTSLIELTDDLDKIKNASAVNSKEISRVEKDLSDRNVILSKSIRSELNNTNSKVTATRDILNKKIDKIFTDIDILQSTINETIKDIDQNNSIINNQLNELEKKQNNHTLSYNPHNIGAEDLSYGKETNIKEAITDLFLSTKNYVEDYNIKLTEDDDLSEILSSLSKYYDFQNSIVTIDLDGNVQKDVQLCNIHTAGKVVIKNGIIENGLSIEKINTEYLFEGIRFNDPKHKVTVDIIDSRLITLIDIAIKGSILVSTSNLYLSGEITVHDKNEVTLICSELGSKVLALGVTIIPPTSRTRFNEMIVANKNSYQYWQGCAIESDVRLDSIAKGNVEIV